MVRAALAGSLAVWGAFAGEKLVGFARVVGDGASIVFIQDVVVAPELHRRGIGTALVRAVLARFRGVYQTELLADDEPGTRAFYESLGFSRAERLGCAAYVCIG
ncbi:GNAT family N-acetyltransferase [Olsenella profusa]|uniref:GNAT family N-acetyltransferase n=1 Tax=Olsenella profusa TaxID=138595 RepID=A0ABS2EZK9_9ACTN|nr:GNAT family N-acetyltransferase [Olsenella profusa]MBM6774013.1 GNAT family N-acetyltransferase [Olsenella profusa]